MTSESLERRRVDLLPVAAGATVIGAMVGAFGWWKNQEVWWGAYLAGWFCWTGLSLGSLSVLMLHNLTGGAWGELVRPSLRSAAAPLPLMFILFLPIALAPERLYEWAIPSHVQHDPILQHKARYLNVDFWRARAFVYFAIWLGLWGMLSWQQRRNPPPGSVSDSRLRRLSGQGLALHGVTITFASVDWLMSLEPHWFSTIYGIIVFSSTGLAALAFGILGVSRDATSGDEARSGFIDQLHDLGKLLFAFLFFWVYVSFSQYFIIWNGNLPEEVVWYVRRLHGAWGMLAGLLITLHFVVPFALLLSQNWKRDPSRVRTIAAMLLVMHSAEIVWLIAPAHAELVGSTTLWLYVALTVGIGGFWLFIQQRSLTRHRNASTSKASDHSVRLSAQ